MDDIPPSFFCPITFDLFKDPVILGNTGHTFERAAITDWLESNTTDPLSNESLTDTTLVVNFALRDAINDYLRRLCGNIVAPADLELGELIGSGSSKDVFRGMLAGNANPQIMQCVSYLFIASNRNKICGCVAFKAIRSH